MDKTFNYNDLDLVRVLIKRTCKELNIDNNLFPATLMFFDEISIEDKLNGDNVIYIPFPRYYYFKQIDRYIKNAVIRHNDYLTKKKIKEQEALDKFNKLTPDEKIIGILLIILANSISYPQQSLSLYPHLYTPLEVLEGGGDINRYGQHGYSYGLNLLHRGL